MTAVSPEIPSAPSDEQVVGQAGDMQFAVQFGPQTRDAAGNDPLMAATLSDMTGKGAAKAKKPEEAQMGASGKAGELIDLAKTQLGVQYVYGAREWGKALDCSGFTQQAYARIGIGIGGDTYTQVTQGQEVGDISQAKPGDLVFFTGDIGMRRNGHVGIYLGNGQFIHAPNSRSQVRIDPIGNRGITAIRRFL